MRVTQCILAHQRMGERSMLAVFRTTALLLLGALTSATAQEQYCRSAGVSSGATAAESTIAQRCRPGDAVALRTTWVGLIARYCDLSRPTLTVDQWVLCTLREQPLSTRSSPLDRGADQGD